MTTEANWPNSSDKSWVLHSTEQGQEEGGILPFWTWIKFPGKCFWLGDGAAALIRASLPSPPLLPMRCCTTLPKIAMVQGLDSELFKTIYNFVPSDIYFYLWILPV